MSEFQLDADKTYATYMAIQGLSEQWRKSADNLKVLGKRVHMRRCRAAADAYDQCANQLDSLLGLIETLQGAEIPENEN